MNKKLTVFFVLLVIFSTASIFGENIRGEVVKSVILSDSDRNKEVQFSMGIEDLFAVSIEKDSEFIEGFEVEIKVPSSLREYGSSFAFSVFKKISPEVTGGIGTYYGTPYDSVIIPQSARFYTQIPYLKRLKHETSPYTTVFSAPLTHDDFPLLFTVLPMMKGFPSSLYSNNYSVKILPLMQDTGNLDLTVQLPEGLEKESLQIKIDGKYASEQQELFELASGTHRLDIDISGGRSISRDFIIRSGSVTGLEVEIEGLESTATINVPENTIVYIDGEKIENDAGTKINITPGEHLVLFMIGDYKISKKFAITPGKDYKISLFLDIFIKEN